jgi:hypothetical protein
MCRENDCGDNGRISQSYVGGWVGSERGIVWALPKKTNMANKAKIPSVGQNTLNPPNSPFKYAVADAADTTAVAVS